MERTSACLGRIMLSILIFITALALLLALREGLASPSYLAALAAGAAAAALLLWGKRTGFSAPLTACAAAWGLPAAPGY